jgi:hypothetical protein
MHGGHVELPPGGPDLAPRAPEDHNMVFFILDKLVGVDLRFNGLGELAEELPGSFRSLVPATPWYPLGLVNLDLQVE